MPITQYNLESPYPGCAPTGNYKALDFGSCIAQLSFNNNDT